MLLADCHGKGVERNVRKGGGYEGEPTPPLPGSSGGVSGQEVFCSPGSCSFIIDAKSMESGGDFSIYQFYPSRIMSENPIVHLLPVIYVTLFQYCYFRNN